MSTGLPSGRDTKIQTLLDRLSQGDESARDALIEYSSGRLRRLTRKMLAKDAVHRWAETDDVWNNSLLRLHRALASVKPESVAHFFNLASCQIQRELVDLARHYFGPEGIGAHHSTEKAAAASDHHPRRDKADTTNDPVKLANWTRFHEQVESLPEEERMVFEQRYYNHLTLIEVSKHWNIPYSKVKSLWGSACERLREAMGDDYPGA